MMNFWMGKRLMKLTPLALDYWMRPESVTKLAVNEMNWRNAA